MNNSVALRGGNWMTKRSQKLKPTVMLCPISIFIDGAHLDHIGRMCVEPMLIDILARWDEVRRTQNSKGLICFLPISSIDS
jgi:hypothetical protein